MLEVIQKQEILEKILDVGLSKDKDVAMSQLLALLPLLANEENYDGGNY